MDPTVGDLATSRQAFHLELRIDVNRRLRRAKGWANLAQRIPGTSVLGTCACLKRHLEPRCWAFYEIGRQSFHEQKTAANTRLRMFTTSLRFGSSMLPLVMLGCRITRG